jgi:hypothetical protein
LFKRRLKFISKSRENKKSPNFAQQSGPLFEMSPKIRENELARNPSAYYFLARDIAGLQILRCEKAQTLRSKVDLCLE